MIRKIFNLSLLLGIIFLFFTKLVLAEETASELFDRGQVAANQGNKTQAIDFYERAIEKDPDFVSPYSALALTYMDQNGNIDDIIWLLQQAADLEPQNAEHYANMCRAYFQNQKHDWAESACLKALSIDPNAGAAKVTLAYVYLYGKEQPGLAIKYFTEILEKVPNPKIYFGLGMAYARNNEQAKALDIITTLRGMREETLASQLEKMLRSSGQSAPSAFVPQRTAVEPAGPSQIIKTHEPEPAVLSPDPNALSPGKIRIQLKARLPTAETNSRQIPKTADEPVDDGYYGPEDYKPLTLKERQERVKRMRGNTGKARGRGTVTTQTQAVQSKF